MTTTHELLQTLARMCGVSTSYTDGFKRRRSVPTESLEAVLRVYGVIESHHDAAGAIERVAGERARLVAEPVVVAWSGARTFVPVNATGTVTVEMRLENGETCRLASEGRRFELPPLPDGYHELSIDSGGTRTDVLVIAAPRKAWQPRDRSWGVFAPVYALRSERNLGVGDLGDARDVIAWLGGLGARMFSTLPLYAAFLDEPFEPSPYAPVSRLFWNELYLDLERVPEVAHVRALADAARNEAAPLRDDDLVDYRRSAALKRRVLTAAARALFERGGARLDEFHRACDGELARYAAFRATVEQRGSTWRAWPDTQAAPDDGDAWRYHAYVQWIARSQLESLSAGLVLDLPLGVHPEGYDTWRHRELFAHGVSAGAPPDTFFSRGQAWGFPPVHPQRAREQRYAYFIACIRNALQHASALRIDHILGFHRMFWVPGGCPAEDGAYVAYPADELYAILTLESQRARKPIIGEDLGTVPPLVRPAMKRHAINRTFVVQEETREDEEPAFGDPASNALATMNTHDMPAFAAWWRGLDVADRVSLGLLDDEQADAESKRRQARREALTELLRKSGELAAGADPDPDEADVLRAALEHLARSRAAFVIASLEDLWSETQQQNTPGTGDGRPNWRRKMRLDVNAIRDDARVADALGVLRGGRT